MTRNGRQNELLELVTARNECSVEELARHFGVSDMTIRRDLALLATQGRVIRTYGGAAPADRISFEFQFRGRAESHAAAKAAIAGAAAKLVHARQTIMLDTGTTTLALARELRGGEKLTVVTASLAIASELQFCEQVKVLLLGGYLRQGSPDVVGPLTEQNLEGLRGDIAFIGADAIGLDGAVYNADMAVARMLKGMIATAKKVYCIADSSKINRQALMRMAWLKDWDALITDGALEPPHQKALQKTGVRIIVAPGMSR